MKVVLHAHSTWSYDGHWTLDRIAQLFGRLGVDAVMMSEHDTGFDATQFADYRAACADASTPRCRLITGIEYSCPENDIHILTWGLDRFLAEHRPVAETLAAVAEAGGASILAHPVRREAWAKFDPAWAQMLSGIELWNRKSDGISWSARARDLIAATGLPATVGMDFHRARHLYPLTHRLDPPAADLPLEAHLVAALRAGRHRPMAFGRPLLDPDGEPRGGLHPRFERLRRSVLAGLRSQTGAMRDAEGLPQAKTFEVFKNK